MLEFNINLGTKEIYSLKNQSFDIHNNGSADLQIDSIRLSSSNVVMLYTKTPFLILQNKFYTLNGYLKIITFDDSTGVDYIECDVSQTDEQGDTQTDVYKYYLDYVGNINNQYVQTFSVNTVTYIKDIFYILIEFSEPFVDQNYPNIIIHTIDNTSKYIFPNVYRVSDRTIAYIYKDDAISNLIIEDHIQMNMIYNKTELDVHKISYRSI